MTAGEVKTSLAKAARRCWPNVTKASDLPFPDYWKAVTEWLTFQAPHVGDALMWKLIDDFAVSAKEAEERGLKPTAPKVSERVKKIWEDHALTGPAQPASLTDSSNIATCGDGGRDRSISETTSVQRQAPARAADPMEQGRLL